MKVIYEGVLHVVGCKIMSATILLPICQPRSCTTDNTSLNLLTTPTLHYYDTTFPDEVSRDGEPSAGPLKAAPYK